MDASHARHAAWRPSSAAIRILVFARAPQPGACKTRLIPRLGAHGAARLHQSLVLRTLRTAFRAAATVELWHAGGHGFFTRCRQRFPLRLRAQRGGDLGRRMAYAIDAALTEDPSPVLLVGTDCLELDPRDLQAAQDALEAGADVVLQPALDGGFVLLGARRRLGGLLRGVRWSSGQELRQTRLRLQRAGLSVRELQPRADIDTPADYRRARRAALL